MFTLLIGDKPVAVIDAGEEEAREIVQSDNFREELKRLRTAGQPLWDGQARLDLRASADEEVAEFDEGEDDLDAADPDDGDEADVPDDDEDLGEEGLAVMFLVPLDEADD